MFRILAPLVVWSASAFAQNNCLPCHEAQVAAFARSGMGRSVSGWSPSAGKFEHEPSHSRLSVRVQNSVMQHRLERNGLSAEYSVALAIGSGKVGQSYAVRIGDALFQSPISWFTQQGHWGMSPGYEREAAPDFDRRITMECLGCHTGMRRVTEPPRAITCEQCHPSTGKHFANPAKIAVRERDSICERCHLQGEARILHPGSSWEDARPSFTTYVSSKTTGTLKVVSHAEQLALSKCAAGSQGVLWCGTCHNPHGPEKEMRQVCTSCHAGTLSAGHPQDTGNCVSCHMPRRPTPEVAHTVYTDHRIRRKPSEDRASGGDPPTLTPWRNANDPYQGRNLGLAYIYAGQRDVSAEWVQKGFAILASVPTKDPEVLSALGLVLLQKQRPKEAASLFAEAARRQPVNGDHLHNWGVSLMAAGDLPGAITQLERAVAMDPLSQPSWLLLARLYQQSGQPGMRDQTLARYLQYMPQNLSVRTVLRR